MEIEVLVYVDIAGTPLLAGRLRAWVRKAKESATFEYDPKRPRDWVLRKPRLIAWPRPLSMRT